MDYDTICAKIKLAQKSDYTQAEVATLCHLSKKTIYKLEQSGKLPYEICVNRLIHTHKIKTTDVLEMLKERHCRQGQGSLYLRTMSHYYIDRLRKEKDVLTISDVIRLTGFSKFGVLKQHPEYVSKEQLRLIAHVSKRKAQYFLHSGLVPCIDNGKKTRNYQIKMTKIIIFLQDREENPDVYSCANSDLIRRLKNGKPVIIPQEEFPLFRRYLQASLKDYQDAMTVRETEQYLGYEHGRIVGWCESGLLKAIPYLHNYRIPKAYLIDFIIHMEGQKTIEQLYDGESFLHECLKVKIAGYKEAKDIAFEAHKIFEGKLCPAMKDELDEFLSKLADVTIFEQTQTFIDGFKLGARLMSEILGED